MKSDKQIMVKSKKRMIITERKAYYLNVMGVSTKAL